MGRFALRLDGPGYKEVAEPGADFAWTGADLVRLGHISNTDQSGLWVPPHSEWIMCRPLNWAPDWWQGDDFSNFLLAQAAWDFSSGFSGAGFVGEWGTHDSPGASYPDDVSMAITVPPSIGTPDITVDWESLETACGQQFPSGTDVIAVTTSGYNGTTTPYLQWHPNPEPEDLLIFGFGDMALVLTQRSAKLIRCGQTDALPNYTDWELLGSTDDPHAAQIDLTSPFPEDARPNMFAVAYTIHYRQLLIYPVGWNQLYLQPNAQAEPWIVTTRNLDVETKEAGSTGQISTGVWWIASAPSSRHRLQVQEVAYAIQGQTRTQEGGGTLAEADEWFNLTSEYTPTTDDEHDQLPILYFDGMFFEGFGAAIAEHGDSVLTVERADGQAISLRVLDEEQETWASDGTHFRGALSLFLQPVASPAAVAQNYTPQVREILMKFPVRLEDGPETNVLLDDTMFKPEFEVETALRDVDGKQLKFPLTQAGAAVLRQSGLDERHDFPVELCEDTADDETYATVRAAGWAVRPPEVNELHLHDNDPETPADDSVVIAQGLLQRAEREWLFTSFICDPDFNGQLLHTKAVEQALLQCGFDVEDEDKVQISDPGEGELDPVLPGSPLETPGNAGETSDHPYAPDLDETPLEYCKRIRAEWTGTWLFYEELVGRVFYREDAIQTMIAEGEAPAIDATFYRTAADAVAASQDPRQIMLHGSERRTERVKANRIRVIPADPKLPNYLCVNTASKTDTDADNYLGRWVTKTLRPKMGVNDRACTRIARMALRQLKRKPRIRTWRSLMPPWQVGVLPGEPAGVDVGSIVELDGIGTYQVIHISMKGKSRTVVETTFTAERLPSLAS